LPAWAWTVTQWWRLRPDGARDRITALLAALPPLLVGLEIGPTVARIVGTFDLGRHLQPASLGGRNPLAAAFEPLHLADLANIGLIYVPALPLLPVALAFRPTRATMDRAAPWLLVISCLPVLLFIRPIQGVFRDLDVFLLPGVATALLLAHTAG